MERSNRVEELSPSEKKDKIQAKIVQRLVEHNGHGIIAGATGVGKTKIAIAYIMHRALLEPLKILWIVPTSTLRDIAIPQEWEKWGYQQFFEDHVKVICYKSLHKETDFYNIIVMDEGHNITLRAYGGVTTRYRRYQSIIVLTATVPGEEIKKKIFRHMKVKVIAKVTVDQAVDMQLVAPFQVFCMYIPLGHVLNFEVKTKVNGKAKRYVTSEHNRYYAIQNKIENYPRGKAPPSLYLARMRSIYRFQSKIAACQKLLGTIPQEQRVLIFCGSIEGAESLSRYRYHSKTTTEDYERFNRKEINRLAVVNALNEGHNMVDVDIAIMVQVNSKERNYVQRQGRAIRWREGHKAKIFILYSEGTVDFKWVRSSLKGIDKEKIHFTYNLSYESAERHQQTVDARREASDRTPTGSQPDHQEE